jgi:hypothetical protein
MDVYHIWCSLKDGREDRAFAQAVSAYLGHFQEGGLIVGWRLLRRKLGFGPENLGEFHVMIETRDLAQLEAAFRSAAMRSGETERLHAEVYSRVETARFALSRDYPDDFGQTVAG